VIPETRYARRGSLHLAYQVLGSGPPDLLLLDQWFSNMEAQWDVPPLAELRERLSAFGRLIMFDKRGSGLSDPVPTSELPTVEQWMDDVPAVLDAVGSDKASVITNLGGGIMAMTYAAAHPERVSSLILVDCFARMLAAPDFPIGAPPEAAEEIDDVTDRGSWGRGMMLDRFAPSAARDDGLRRAWARYERMATSPGNAAVTVRSIWASDVRAVLPAIRVPTLVIHRADDRGLSVEHGRYLARQIPNAKYVELPGIDSLLWAGDQDAVAAEIQDFVTGVRPMPTPHRVLATVLFTDIVGSTQLAAAMGDERWRMLLDEHNRVARQQLDRSGGHEIKTVGDGILATFDGPARAIRCAVAIRDAVRDLGLQVRAGLHTGEIEVEPDDIAGIAVHIGARISALANGGEVLVSGTVRDLVVGSGIEFEDRGAHVLKGVPGEWRVFAVAL
jgi:class 3 adenylate cyclase